MPRNHRIEERKEKYDNWKEDKVLKKKNHLIEEYVPNFNEELLQFFWYYWKEIKLFFGLKDRNSKCWTYKYL